MLDLKQLPLMAAISLGVLIAAGVTWQGLGLYQQWQSPQPQLEQSASAGNKKASPARDLAIEEVLLFGQPGQEEEGPELVETENLPETNLRLTLRGVMAGEREATRNSALVEGPDKETDLYFVGQELPGNARLHKVHERRIVIERGGALETLHFPDEEELSMSASRSGSGRSSRRSSSRGNGGLNNVRMNSGDNSSRQQEVRARLDELRQRLRNN
ncbi:MAG: type II secretion system protein N [Oleiphilaceae bacterium]|nr:type II secretion system protein N [Oleiphilaceae bacterium]